MHSPFVGAYWAARREPKEQCADRALEYFRRISLLPGLGQWYKKGGSVKAALKSRLEMTREGFFGALKERRQDIGGAAMPEVGFSLSAWNGDASASASVSITCGAFSPAIRNVVLLKLPSFDEVDDEQLELFRQLMDAGIEIWQPDHAVATSTQLIAAQGGGMPWTVKGWYNYP